MKTRIATITLMATALSIVSLQANAEKVVGTCKVEVTGPHPFTISGKAYEGKAPENSYQSNASTHAWMLQTAEEYRSIAAQIADMKKHMAEDVGFALRISCTSEKGTMLIQPYGGTAKTADYPGGAHVFRLVNDDLREKKPGDLTAVLISREFQTGSIQPAEPGEFKITQSDGEKLVATFSFKSRTSSVTGSVDFTRPKEIVK